MILMSESCAGGSRYGVIVVIVVVGYGYVWWKVIIYSYSSSGTIK